MVMLILICVFQASWLLSFLAFVPFASFCFSAVCCTYSAENVSNITRKFLKRQRPCFLRTARSNNRISTDTPMKLLVAPNTVLLCSAPTCILYVHKIHVVHEKHPEYHIQRTELHRRTELVILLWEGRCALPPTPPPAL